ncbi:hypothetical protein COT42_00185 [Candidatus Saganbacteria bacterium CG08_land_8_20_14_0_20_45_16]|uniref:Lipid-A-disaccharide synthase n=1 Tax=Candidatus Saganbacteria bacterium CG08_land_8_20_14_0_20_45_16 TaxID=2014293 RepID=A0A2H0Y1Y8_UNCSA|nr:MAG: hypothetical protein COT42_00185 [Candidatus Saganbacteria bacterium CG08_land_8_20_14_0_20_45_16]
MKKILLISNGHAEDLVADKLIAEFGQSCEITKLPLVNTSLPSGGFSLRNFKFLWQDIRRGLLGQTIKNILALKRLRGKIDVSIAIGDLVPIIGALIAGAPFVFVGVNKSSYYKTFGYNYTPWEKFLLKKYAIKTYVRDEETLKDLTFAKYVGNPLMDCLLPLSIKWRGVAEQSSAGVRIGFLPGTRADAKLNLKDFADIAKEIIKLKPAQVEVALITATKEKDVPAYLQNKPFEQVLEQATMIIGLSGTGNEQAAGCGIPIIAFPGRGSQYNKKFAKAQKELLGEALILIDHFDPSFIAGQVWELVKDPDRQEQMSQTGQSRMGQGRAIKQIGIDLNEIIQPR